MSLSATAAPFAWSLALTGAVVVLSTVPLGAARSQADFSLSDLQAPRAMFERLSPWGKRAAWAHQNSFEAFTLHAPAALLCLIVALASPGGLTAPVAVAVAWIHPLLRLAYLAAYIGNLPPLRGLCWAGGLICSGVLYVEGLRALLG
ncbi:MAPEG family protein [Cyanobium sp. NIES-981]|uniref:MAPEG family protein n=1 Tax=Cyanobium sp. NIES-981 TaxID=1851505 RepID=UPI0007DE2211|nr:MAPEG family protein [Cyanobium sp. NIES-981]SBO41739.1 Mapeg family protein [Cyanobium sp. NIES-981]